MIESELHSTLDRYVFHTLMLLLICTLLAWCTNYHWNRRKLYQMAAQRKGPLTLPFIGSALYFRGSNGDILNNFLRLTKEFESPVTIWFGQRLFFGIWKANDMETILNNPYALEKGELFKFLKIVTGGGLPTASVPKWKQHRKIIMPTFNQTILNEFVEIHSEQSKILVDQLKLEAGKGTFDILNYVSRCSLDIICETAMGITVNAQTTESDFCKWVNKALQVTFARMFGIQYHYDFIFSRTSMAKELNDAMRKINEFTTAVIRDKKAAYRKKLKENRERSDTLFEEEPCKRKPFLDQLIKLSEEGGNLTDEELLDEVKTFILAGSESTSTTVSFVFSMLGMFPDIQHAVFEEVIDVLGPDRPVEHTDLGKLQYLERVIKETMRIFPVGQFITRAIDKDIQLESCTIPAGSSVLLFLISAHRDPNVWPNPLEFDPDRFLPEEVAKRHPYSFLPFSGGPRNCIGLKYGMMTMKVLIAMVIRKYRLFTDYKNIEAIELKADVALKPVNGFRVSIELRK